MYGTNRPWLLALVCAMFVVAALLVQSTGMRFLWGVLAVCYLMLALGERAKRQRGASASQAGEADTESAGHMDANAKQ